jgi:uncharacterized protein YbjT (DUF2867 family)
MGRVCMKVLITGASGYIGRRLKNRLKEYADIKIRVLVRNADSASFSSDIEVREGNSLNISDLENALKGIDIAYYLIHSMESKDYKSLDKISAKNFLDVSIKNGVKKIIYLGGLGDIKSASKHLASRIETGEILSSKPTEIQTLWFRAGVIVGSGSASFEIIRNIAEKLPLMIAPQWIKTYCQPTSEKDVVEYLAQAVFLKDSKSKIIDIGSTKMMYKELIEKYAKIVGLRRKLIPLPFLTPKLSSYWLALVSPVPYSIASELVEGLKSEVLVTNKNAKLLFPNIKPMSYKKAVLSAIKEIKNNQIISRWSDANGASWDADHTNIEEAVFKDRQLVPIGDANISKLFQSFCLIGGNNGWFSSNWMWRLRGFMDKLLGGYGLQRGRRDINKLRKGDSVDFWKVADIVEDERLLLYSQMKVPGEAWLEFLISGDTFIQTAYFYPKGLLGRFYWYALVPFHYFIFRKMIKNILSKAIM